MIVVANFLIGNKFQNSFVLLFSNVLLLQPVVVRISLSRCTRIVYDAIFRSICITSPLASRACQPYRTFPGACTFLLGSVGYCRKGNIRFQFLVFHTSYGISGGMIAYGLLDSPGILSFHYSCLFVHDLSFISFSHACFGSYITFLVNLGSFIQCVFIWYSFRLLVSKNSI